VLVSADVSLQNNYVSVPKSQTNNTAAEAAAKPHGGVIENISNADKSASVHLFLRAPSFIFRVNKMAFGFHAAVRSDLSIRNVPASLAKVAFEGLPYAPLHNTDMSADGLRIGSLTWAETGISAGKMLKIGNEKVCLGAITVKYVAAFAGAYFQLDDASLNVANDSSFTLNNLSGELDYAFSDNPADALTFKGRGASIDFGVNYIFHPYPDGTTKQSAGPVKKYKSRLGISLVDAGFVSFTKNSRAFNFSNQSLTLNKVGGKKANGTQGVDSLISVSVMNGKSPARSFVMALPTALSIQYDRCLAARWYVNASIVQRVNLPLAQVDRANNLSASIRYETTFFEIAIPYSLYDYYDHRIGAAMRYHFLFAGTDKLGTLIGSENISGLDFYFGIKVSSFEFLKKNKTGKRFGCAPFC
jgi:hypothetical protein